MSGIPNHERVVDLLATVHDASAEWIRAADTKAGLLLALLGGASTIVLAQAGSNAESMEVHEWCMLAGWGLASAVSIWYCLICLLPRLETADGMSSGEAAGAGRRVWLLLRTLGRSLRPVNLIWGLPVPPATDTPPATENALYFGAIANSSPEEIRKLMNSLGGDSETLELAYAVQTKALAMIAHAKMRRLQYATAWMMVSVLVVVALQVELLR